MVAHELREERDVEKRATTRVAACINKQNRPNGQAEPNWAATITSGLKPSLSTVILSSIPGAPIDSNRPKYITLPLNPQTPDALTDRRSVGDCRHAGYRLSSPGRNRTLMAMPTTRTSTSKMLITHSQPPTRTNIRLVPLCM